MASRYLRALALLSLAAAQEPNITRCTSGAANITTGKAFHVQVCNLFGATCYINHPYIQDCATESLEILSGECKLYPIFEYVDKWVRSGASAVEELSTQNDLGCTEFISDGKAQLSGACAAVQCSLGGGAWAGPGMTGNSPPTRETGVTNTATAAWTNFSIVEISDDAKQLKNVFLYRTGDYVATTRRTYTWSTGGVTLSTGKLPTSNGNNYGPVACPAQNTLLSDASISASDLKMCGATGKWVYYNAVNLLNDASLYATYSGDTGTTTSKNMAAVPFLDGRSGFQSGDRMDDARAVMLHSGDAASSAVLLTSGTFTPKVDFTGEVAGTWRSYGVVFYCDDYARTDLTQCAEANRKMLYVADPNPEEQFGTTSSLSGSGTAGDGTTSGGLRALASLASFAWSFLCFGLLSS
ncbi:unnamed protein product [Symbiodinium natans]|uniref:Uncharacterized protein n=1 Tax=Symbiodinium natans TaxID=878477 RepID=A0A812UTE0_9DINO|nr:unnamed protein product [Symbiodinium natans]